MRTLPFIKFSPGGNTTVLIPHVTLTAAERAVAASEMLSELHLGAEQVGYVKTDGLPRLTMMGGEFCVNATRCFAVYLAVGGLLRPVPRTGWFHGEVSVSGRDAPVQVRVRGAEGVYEAAARLTGELALTARGEGISQVAMPGITHLVLDAALHPVPEDEAGRKVQADELLAAHGLKGEDAAGVIWMGDAFIVPVVWVRHTQSLCAESACGSGTLAAAHVRASRCPGQKAWRFEQPSGDALTVQYEDGQEAASNAPVVAYGAGAGWISGLVRVVAEGTVRVWSLDDTQMSDV